MAILSQIVEAKRNYEDARENLDRIRREYANEPELLNFYEPSAILLVEKFKSCLDRLKGELM